MDKSTNNPAANSLSPGISEADLQEAVDASGYPLQTIVYDVLKKSGFHAQQEWSFVDSEERVVRSIDLLAGRALFEWREPQPRVRPELNLVIECKRSELPYVFFLSEERISTPRFPSVVGLATDSIRVKTDDDPSTWIFSPLRALSLDGHSFLQDECPFATTFSRCERQGQKLRLSGADSYNSLVHPLMKAAEHFGVAEQPPQSAIYFDLHLVIPLAVLDAPMVATETSGAKNKLTLLPWVRVPRHRSPEQLDFTHRDNVYAIDIVHISFLARYLAEHLVPFASKAGQLALKHQKELAEGAGFVPGMGARGRYDIEARLTPRTLTAGARGIASIGKRVAKKLLKKRKG